MNLILPASEIGEQFRVWAEEYVLDHALSVTEDADFDELIEVIIDESLSRRMIWCRSEKERRMDELLVKAFPWFSPACQDDLSAGFYCQIVDHIFLLVDSMVAEIVPMDTWSVCYMRRIGEDVAIEVGQDYRIMEFERHVRSGDLPVNSHIARLYGIDTDEAGDME